MDLFFKFPFPEILFKKNIPGWLLVLFIDCLTRVNHSRPFCRVCVSECVCVHVWVCVWVWECVCARSFYLHSWQIRLPLSLYLSLSLNLSLSLSSPTFFLNLTLSQTITVTLSLFLYWLLCLHLYMYFFTFHCTDNVLSLFVLLLRKNKHLVAQTGYFPSFVSPTLTLSLPTLSRSPSLNLALTL